ncbi:MAG: hypothetical protein COV71_02840 [Candidatus Omnitrophica bacterium CG11_big_fil_rev_8_21_14_0_20_41_12]|nr:MAG: hypothetical protein COV71_02840 [Candidatus Omnitrophica bacterium CG11_big_fil_rev_8_21_14_0_20_41_12]
MDKQTSDERLLKIIEGSSEPRRAKINLPGTKKSFGLPTGSRFDLVALKGIFKNLKFDLVKVNKGLIGLGAFLTLIFIYTLFSAPAISKSNAAYFTPADSKAVLKFISAGREQGAMRKNISGESLRRDFFMPPSFKGSGVIAEEDVDVLNELKDFKLVGVIWSKNPEVMIENAKDSRTYTLKKGESFSSQFKIKEISRNSATLEVNLGASTREYELR